MTAFQDAAGAVGEGLDPHGEEDPAAGAEERCAVAYEAGGVVSPDGEHQLSADDRAKRAADAGDDHPQLARAAADATDRLPAVHCEHDVGFDVLPGEPEGAVSEELVHVDPLYSVRDGAGRSGIDDHQHQGGTRGLVWREERVCPDAEYSVKKRGERSQAKVYRKRLGIVPWIELAIGCYFAWTVYYAITTENFFTVPFLVLFVFGYWYNRVVEPAAGRFERSGDRGQRMHEKPYPVGV